MKKGLLAYLVTMALFFSLVPSNVLAAERKFGDTIASANGRVLAIQKDGSLWYWGKGTFNDSRGDQSPQRASKSKLMDDVIAVYGNWWSSFAIKSDHSLWSIQSDENDQGVTKPIKVMEGVREATASYSKVLVLKTDGTVWVKPAYADNKSFKQVMSGVKQISANLNCYYALKEDDSLWGWGDNYSGGLGIKTQEVDIIAPVKIMMDVKSVHGIGSNAFAIKKDSTLWGWGKNEDGLLFTGKGETWAFKPYADGSQSIVKAQFTPVKIMSDVIKVDGRNHIAVIKKDHSLWTWGGNQEGQLGDGSTESRYTPQKVLDDVIDITAKAAFTFALKSDGNLMGSGSNGVGELALDTFDYDPHPTPIQIMDNVAIPYTTASFPSVWAKDDVSFAIKNKLLPLSMQSGYEKNITRGEFISLIVPLIETTTGKELDTIMNEKGLKLAEPFNDTDDNNILNIAAFGIITGVGDGRFNPNGLITREQASLILMKTSKFIGIDSEIRVDSNKSFTDHNQISAWAEESVYFCTTNEIMKGTGNNNFSPKAHYTREMSVITIVRLYGQISGQVT
ncbi:S-layer homology domain-containing protein [Paenibacillus sp. Leaf72]|uniref:S-layer homology domain-containing protein n=1 Tax=Paenibacillus sp. Leaf72 TaxID=1736234 RepID=UPI0006F3D903|nr:S-layer homology domain-containing protein [Paenibacillus sp. Leaf72]KQO18715.1 hypothetical protein ASF12_09050 [Paenibacillus sp. Leaf72]